MCQVALHSNAPGATGVAMIEKTEIIGDFNHNLW